MDFDIDEMKALVGRINYGGRLDSPPATVLHPVALLAGTDPEHLVAGFIDQSGEDPARWQVVALSGRRLTFVAASAMRRGWSWPDEFHRGQEALEMTAWTKMIGSDWHVAIDRTTSFGNFDSKVSIANASADWVLHCGAAGNINLPFGRTDPESVETFVAALVERL